MLRYDFEDLEMDELVEIILDYDGYDIITRDEFETLAKDDIDYGYYGDAMEKLKELENEGEYFIYNEKYSCYEVFDEYDARRLIEKDNLLDIEEDEEIDEEEERWNYLEREADERRDEEE